MEVVEGSVLETIGDGQAGPVTVTVGATYVMVPVALDWQVTWVTMEHAQKVASWT